MKAALVLLALLVTGNGFMNRYRIGIDPQNEKCLPGYTVYLIDLNDRSLQKERFTPSTQRTSNRSTKTAPVWSRSWLECLGT